jgi:hypothetical protein
LLAHGPWFSPGTLVSPTTKTRRHDIAEILPKVAPILMSIIVVEKGTEVENGHEQRWFISFRLKKNPVFVDSPQCSVENTLNHKRNVLRNF